MLLLAGEPLPASWHKRWPEKVWQIMLSLLLITTGGAMLAGAGEIWAQVLPLRWSNALGLLVTLLLGWLLAMKTKSGLAWVSRGLVTVLMLLLLLAFRMSPMQGAVIVEQSGPIAILSGGSYGGFNAALQWPILAAATIEKQKKRSALRWATVLILLMLLLGMLLMQRHKALMGEAMPFLLMMKQFGAGGYIGFIICLYLAVLSTLTACIRAVQGRAFPMAGILLVSCGGFGGVVNLMYPLLGGGCCIMLLLAKITNYLASPFLSRKDML